MVYGFIQDNFVAVAITSFLILFIRTNNNFEKRTNRLFLAAASCIFVLIFTEAWEAQLAMEPSYQALRVPLSAIGYSLRPLVPYFLLMINKSNSKVGFALLTLPAAGNILIAFSALFCKISFWYTPDNQFARGPLGIAPFLVACFYIVFLLIRTMKFASRESVMEALIVSAIVMLAFLSTLLESLFHFRFIQNPSMATSITFYYLFLHSNRNNRDTLTGALTRRRFYLDADKYHTTVTAVISLDLNDLKTLNDKYGHMEGDKALVAVTDIIRRNTGNRAALYRVGGDEFMILCYKLSEDAVQDMIDRVRGDLGKTTYRCAIGYAMYSSKMNFDQACHMADNGMYENKRQMKAQTPEPRL